MAKRFLTPLNLPNLASNPETGSEGDLYYNTVDNVINIYRGDEWIQIGGSADAIVNTNVDQPSPTLSTGLLHFNPNDFTFNISYGGTWLQLASVVQPITGGNSSTTEFNNIFDGGDSSSTYDSFLIGGNS